MHFNLSKTCAALLLGYFSTEVTAFSPPIASSHNPVLKAATKRSDLFRRDTRIRRSFDADLSFIEAENGWQNHEIFASSLKVQAEAPIIALEDIEHHLNDVKCTKSSMKLEFVSPVSARDAHAACDHEKGGYIITSHSTCNVEGERAVYRISGMHMSKDDLSLEMDIEEVRWKEAFSHFDISFGYTTEGHLFRRHSNFKKRQQPASSAASRSAASAISSSANSSTSGSLASAITPAPIPIPSNITAQNSASFDLAFSTANSTFTLPPIPNNPLAKIPLQVGCKECKTSGKVILTQGNIQINLKNIDLIPDFIDGEDNQTAFSAIQGGFVELEAQDLNAHIELRSVPSGGQSFSYTLFGLPIAGFIIPNVGSAGVSFNGSVVGAYQVTGGIEFTYGFNLALPQSSKIRIDLGSFKNSTSTGFDQAKLEALPFTANLTDIELTLSAGFRPTIPIGFNFDEKVKVQMEAFMDLPKLEAKISTKTGQGDIRCNTPSNGTNSTATPTVPQNETSPFLPASVLPSMINDIGTLIHIDPSINLAIGVGADFNVPGVKGLPPLKTAIEIFSTKFGLPTACLAAKSGFTPATKVLAEKTSSYIASASTASLASAASASAASASANASQPNKGLPTPSGNSARSLKVSSIFVAEGGIWALCVFALSVVAGGMVML